MSLDAILGWIMFWMYWSDMDSPPGIFAIVGWVDDTSVSVSESSKVSCVKDGMFWKEVGSRVLKDPLWIIWGGALDDGLHVFPASLVLLS